MTNYSSCHGNVNEDLEATESDEPSTFNWRSSIRKKFSRLSKKKRPTSLNFDALSSPPVISDTLGLSSQSLLFPAYENNMKTVTTFSSNSLTSETENYFVSYQPKNSNFKEQSKFYSQGNVSSVNENLNAVDRNSPKFPENLSSDIKSRFKKLVKKGHLSASISSLSSKLKESFQTPYDNLLANNFKPVQTSFDNEKERIYQHFRRRKHSSGSKAKDDLKASARYSIGCYPEALTDSYEKNVWTDPCHPVTSSYERTKFPLDEVIHSIRHIDSSSEDDLADDAITKINVSPSSVNSEVPQRCHSDWMDRRRMASPNTMKSTNNVEKFKEVSESCHIGLSKIKSDIKENRKILQACLNNRNEISNYGKFSNSSYKSSVPSTYSISGCSERETHSLKNGNLNDDSSLNKSLPTTKQLHFSATRKLDNCDTYSSCSYDSTYSKCYQFSGAIKHEDEKLSTKSNQDRKIRPNRYLESSLMGTESSQENSKLVNKESKVNSKDSERIHIRNWKPSMKDSHKERSDSLFEILNRLKDQLNKEKLRRNQSNLINDGFANNRKTTKSHTGSTNGVGPKSNLSTLVIPKELNEVNKEEECLPSIKSTLIKVHEFDSCIEGIPEFDSCIEGIPEFDSCKEAIPEFDNLTLINDEISVSKSISISSDARVIANIATDDNAFNILHNYDVEQTRNRFEIGKNEISMGNCSNYFSEPINGTKIDVIKITEELKSSEHDQESENNPANDFRTKKLHKFNDSCGRFDSVSNVNSSIDDGKSEEKKRFCSENLRNQKITSSESNLSHQRLNKKKLDTAEIDTFDILKSTYYRHPTKRNSPGHVEFFSLENLNILNDRISIVQKLERSLSEISLFIYNKGLHSLSIDSQFEKSKLAAIAQINKVFPENSFFTSKKTDCHSVSELPEKTKNCAVTKVNDEKPPLPISKRKKNKRRRKRRRNSKNTGTLLNKSTCVEVSDRATEELQRDNDLDSHPLICTDAICNVPESFPSLGPRATNEVPLCENEETVERTLRINCTPEDQPCCIGQPCDALSLGGHGSVVPLLYCHERSEMPYSMPNHSSSLCNYYDYSSSFCINSGSINQYYNEYSNSNNNAELYHYKLNQRLSTQAYNDIRVPRVNYYDPLVPTIKPCTNFLLNYAREEVSFVEWERTSDYCDIIDEEGNDAKNEIIGGKDKRLNCNGDSISNLVQSQFSDSHSKMPMNLPFENEKFDNFYIERDRCLGIDVNDVNEMKNHLNGDVKLRSEMRSFKHRTSNDNDNEMSTGISSVSKATISDKSKVALNNTDKLGDYVIQNCLTYSQTDYKLPVSQLEDRSYPFSEQVISEFISFITDIFIYKHKCFYYDGIEKDPFWKIVISYHNLKRKKLFLPVLQLQKKSDDLKSVRWVLSHGEDLLDFHQVPQNTLLGITRQVDSFNHFYSTAKREADKGASLLLQEEESILPSEDFEEAQDLAKNLRRHLSSFANRLHLTKDRLEDTAKCYLLLDKAYEWALEAMKAVGRVKTSGTATPEQVGAAVEAIGGILQENPPVPEETFSAMLDMASKLNNQTLLQQCKMAHARCEETMALLRSRQASLLKARRQMEFDCQSFVDLNEVIEEPPPLTWLSGTPLNNSGRRRSGCSIGSRPRDPLSRCSSFDTDDDSVFSESPFNSTPSKMPVEAKSSLGGIKELRESDEDLRGNRNFVRSPRSYMRSSAIDFRLAVSTVDPPIVLERTSPPPTLLHSATTSTVRAFSSGSSSCSSSDSSGPITGNNLFKDHSRSSWRFSDTSHRSAEEANDSLDESINPLSPLSNRCSLPSAANSHLLIRGSQINLSNSEDLSNEEVRKNKTLLLIMQELIQTERDYVNSLEYIIENYGPELLRDDIPQALRGQRNVIFGNIEKIFEFHSGYFLRSLENCQARPFAVGSIFLKYESQFYLYALYNKNKPKSDDLMSELGSNFFKGKQMELGDKMDLSSYLLKPVQRMGKYALLLKQLLKECDRNEEGFEDLKAAEEMVQFQLRHGNDLLAMDSLRDCDVNLKEQGRLLRQGEFLVSEGNKGKKALRHVFLFEDLILFSKTKRDPEKKTLDVFQYKQSLKTSDIGLTEQVGDNPLKFEIWFRKRKPSDTFVLQASSLSMKEAWTDEISKLLWRQALKNRKLRLHEMSSMGIGNKPCLDIRPSEDQINDRSVCMGKAPPRLRLSSSNGLSDNSSGVRRPHSVISISSSGSSTGSSHSSSAGPSFVGTLNLGFESGDSPKPLQRSVTRTSQCSAESGILADLFPERDVEDNHSKVERSNSTATNTSVDSVLSPSSPLSPTSYPSSPITLSISDGVSTHPLSRQLLSVEGPTNKTLLTTEV